MQRERSSIARLRRLQYQLLRAFRVISYIRGDRKHARALLQVEWLINYIVERAPQCPLMRRRDDASLTDSVYIVR